MKSMVVFNLYLVHEGGIREGLYHFRCEEDEHNYGFRVSMLYALYCDVHPEAVTMNIEITVTAEKTVFRAVPKKL